MQEKQDALTLKHRVGYALGDFGGCMTFGLMTAFLTRYYVNVALMDTAVIAVMTLIWKIFDAVSNPVVGVLLDKAFANSDGKKGKFRPWILRVSPLLSVSAILVFTAPSWVTGAARMVVAFTTYLSYELIYAIHSICLGGLLPAMAKNDAERAELSSARGIGAALGSIIPMTLFPVLLSRFDSNQQLGYGVSMGANSLGTADAEDYFASGKFGMFVDGRWEVPTLRKNMTENSKWGAGSWNVAPLPVYKEYDANGNVTVHGIAGGHSGSMGLAIAEGSDNKQAAFEFLKFVAGEEGQKAQAEAGFAIPNQKALASQDVFLQPTQDPANAIVFVEAAGMQRPGDWWSLTNSAWIDDWANYLNYTVRENKATVNEMFDKYAESTQEKLYEYTDYKG